MPTLDDVAAAMRARFTPAQAGQTVAETRITADEWAALAALIYLRDAIEEVAADPRNAGLVVSPTFDRAMREAAQTRTLDPTRRRP